MGVSGVEGVDDPTCVPSWSSRDPPTVLNTVVRGPSHRQQHHLARASVSLFSDLFSGLFSAKEVNDELWIGLLKDTAIMIAFLSIREI